MKPPAAQAPLLEVRNLHKHFGGNRAVDGVSFALGAGELLALIGPNGAGKSTLFNLLNGQLAPDAGQIILNVGAGGQRLDGRSPREIAALGVGRTFQIAEVFPSLTVLANVQTALRSAQAGAAGWRNPWGLAERQPADAALALLAEVGMAEQAQRPCNDLAYGDVKRVELAMALARRPVLLLMDEPTAGMAPAERHALMRLTARLVAERGMAVLFTEHSMDVVFGHAERILVLARGRVIADGAPEAIRADARVQEVYLGRPAAAPEPAAPTTAGAPP